MATAAKAVTVYPHGYTAGSRSIASAVREAIAMSLEWGCEPVAVYRGTTTKDYFGMVETIAGSMSNARLVCWITAPDVTVVAE